MKVLRNRSSVHVIIVQCNQCLTAYWNPLTAVSNLSFGKLFTLVTFGCQFNSFLLFRLLSNLSYTSHRSILVCTVRQIWTEWWNKPQKAFLWNSWKLTAPFTAGIMYLFLSLQKLTKGRQAPFPIFSSFILSSPFLCTDDYCNQQSMFHLKLITFIEYLHCTVFI